ncbi:MAG TPA: sulfite exporter TauE/SafE family protein [Alphaproteobacteria bacterium]|nr:sulfite exporter TauE/SafE family protein [Alphaproteobacteria bacterium]
MDPAHHDLFEGLAAICGSAFARPGLIGSLFLAGLAGSISHCAGMCGPFVLTQVTARLRRVPVDDFGGWARLRGAALVPYHLGRLTTYSALGAAAGGLTGRFMEAPELRWLSSAFLLLAAALFLAQIGADVLPRSGRGTGPVGVARLVGRAVDLVSRPIGDLFADPHGWRGYGLGIALGFLPCGLLYSALAASAAGGSTAAGAAAMAAFVAGTFPVLFAIAWGGTVLGRSWRGALKRLAQPLLAVNAVLLVALAVRDLL